MITRLATDDEISRWDDLLAANSDGGNVFQSVEMAETKRRGGWIPRYAIVDNVAMTILEKSVLFLGAFWYLPKGPGVNTSEELLSVLPELRELARSQGVFAIKIEPEIIESDEAHQTLRAYGLTRTSAVQPNSSTVLIDLSPELDAVLASLNQKGRHALKRAERDGVTATAVELTEENMRKMFDLLSDTAAGRFETSLRSYEYYREFWQRFVDNGRGGLFFAVYEGKLVAAAFCMYLGKKGLYKDGASIREKTAYGASHLLQWEVIKWMKERGVTSYDLCGAPHSTQIHNEQGHFYGIGRFKTSFNKHVTDYVGCYDLPVKSVSYAIWQKIGRRLALSLSYRLKKRQWF